MLQELAQPQVRPLRRAAAALVQAGHQVEEEDVVHLRHAGRKLAGHAAHRQHAEPLLLAQLRDQAGVDQRAFARARLGVEEQQPLGDDARQQAGRLRLAAEEALAVGSGKGARADVGVGRGVGCGRGHGSSLSGCLLRDNVKREA